MSNLSPRENSDDSPSVPLTHQEKRANHNAIERARRESLNYRFQELAQLVPSLLQVRKPSKFTIVDKSVEYVFECNQRLDIKVVS